MIVLSFLLVIIAAVALVVGLVQDSLSWIWASIGSCVVAMILLGIGVLQRRGTPARAKGEAPPDADEEESGADGRAEEAPADDGSEGGDTAASAGDVAVLPKRTAGDARESIVRTSGDVREASRAATVVGARPDRSAAAAEPEAPEAAAEERDEHPVADDEAASAPTQRGGERSAREEPPEGTAETDTGGGTRGDEAMQRLRSIKGLGTRKAQALLAAFGSLEGIKAASKEELMAVKGVGASTAEQLKDEL